MKIAIVSLGCPKNQVDADVFCRSLLEDGHQTVDDISFADVVIINTCGFIQSAKEEAIENILAACQYKNTNPNLKVVVTGCLAERYQDEVALELPEVDAVVGIGSNQNLPQIVKELCAPSHNSANQLQSYGSKSNLALGGTRVISTPQHYAWLKISEGCNNACSYCAIPLIRGGLRSRTVEDCVQEAKWLAEQGVKELVLVAQDVTAFGEDRGQNELSVLLSALNAIDSVEWIRMLYTYPERITKEFINTVQENSKVLHYFDMPIQHINNDILESMRRKGNKETITGAIQLIRDIFPDATLRTTLITGYPGETQEQFEELCDFVKQIQFERLGCFAYSPEEGTFAATLPNQVPHEICVQRADIVMKIQSEIMLNKQASLIGKTMQIIVDEYDEEENVWWCRSKADAPEIDVNVFLPGSVPLLQGNIYETTIIVAEGYDLYAENARIFN